MGFAENIKLKKIFSPKESADFLKISTHKGTFKKKQQGKGKPPIEYFEFPAGFDIETSSFISADGGKTAIMYEWTFGINGLILIGRTWNEFLSLMQDVISYLDLREDRRLLIGVHNLGYEFQFIREYFEWETVFASDTRKPIYAATVDGLEFRDTLILSGYKLETVGKNLHTYPVEKMSGDLDYKKIRHSETPLTAKELKYCVNDVKVVMSFLQEKIEDERNITGLPLTKTGYVRRYVRKACLYKEGKKPNYNYFQKMQELTLRPDEYLMLKRAFQGGFTHANPFYSGELLHGVRSMDLTSSYPTQLCLAKFPMSCGRDHKIASPEDFRESLKNFCCLFDIEFIGLQETFPFDNYISRSRCTVCENPTVNNGRIAAADRIVTTITELDYFIIEKTYKWRSCRIGRMIRYKRGYLPKSFILSVLGLYKDKTELKGLTGLSPEGIPYPVLYMNKKEKLNSCFGMTCTDIIRPEIYYDTQWEMTAPDLDEAIEKYNTNKKRFLFYPWGIWTTAAARYAVWTAIINMGEDHIYTDTDSEKYLHPEKHQRFFEWYNRKIIKELESMCLHFEILFDYIRPKNAEGKEKPLGIWDFDGDYTDFKTLGAKRYLGRYADGKYNLTVSGLNKKIALPYLLETYGDAGIFDAFSADLYIPKGKTGKNIHGYIDEERSGEVTDYCGKTLHYDERSAVYMEEADYTMSLSEEYVNFMLDIKEEREGL